MDVTSTGRSSAIIARPATGKPSGSALPASLERAMFERAVGEVAGPLTLENGDQVLALVTKTHLPTIDAATFKPSSADREAGARLSQGIEDKAYQFFSTRHEVTINPDLMRSKPTEE
jgi:hypothetical protein